MPDKNKNFRGSLVLMTSRENDQGASQSVLTEFYYQFSSNNKEANKQTIYDGLAIYFLRDGLSLSAVSFIRLSPQRHRPGHQQYVRDILWLFAYCSLSRVLLVTSLSGKSHF